MTSNQTINVTDVCDEENITNQTPNHNENSIAGNNSNNSSSHHNLDDPNEILVADHVVENKI